MFDTTLKKALNASSQETVDDVDVLAYSYPGAIDEVVTMTLADERRVSFDQQQTITVGRHGQAYALDTNGERFTLSFQVVLPLAKEHL